MKLFASLIISFANIALWWVLYFAEPTVYNYGYTPLALTTALAVLIISVLGILYLFNKEIFKA